MSSQYPILDNRPIDQWKVTELKEELKRRKLPLKGLKDDLIKRLNEAIRTERENAVMAESEPQPAVEVKNAKDAGGSAKLIKDAAADKSEADSIKVLVDVNKSVGDIEQEHDRGFIVDSGNSLRVEGGLNVNAHTLKAIVRDTEDAASEAPLTGQVAQDTGIQEDKGVSNIQKEQEDSKTKVSSGDSKARMAYEGSVTQLDHEDSAAHLDNKDPKVNAQLGNEDPKSQVQLVNADPYTQVQMDNEDPNTQAQIDNEDSKIQAQLDIEDSKTQLDREDSNICKGNEGLKPLQEKDVLKPLHEDVIDSSAPANQVSEVSPNLGFEIISDSISTDSVSNNEKIELKDNVITDTVKLELDDIKAEMVEPSSSNVVAVGGKWHPMDVEEPQEKASGEEEDESNATVADVSKNNDSLDAGYSEKLNLDRSSGDESMEEDVLDIKQIDSKYNSNEKGDKSEKSEVHVLKEENLIDVTGSDLPMDQKEVHVENKIHGHAAVPAEKRKLNDQEAHGNSEPVKRQRRWNSENIKTSEQQNSVLTSSTTPKSAFQPIPFRRNFSISDSSVSEETPKERVVPPSQKSPTNSLRIDHFLRPFTLKAVQDLLGKTGTVTSFWMDHIKTHCYVTYSTVEEAIQTRNAVYNLQWPANGGRLLVAEFVDPQEVLVRVEAPAQSPAAPVTPSATAPAPPTMQPQPTPRQQVSRQQVPLLPPPPPAQPKPSTGREWPAHPPPPPPQERHDPPIVTLDDLFRKTKTTPRIYYLPLSEEQVAAKLAERGKTK